MKKQIFRQGDVLLVRVEDIPADAVPCQVDGDVILAYGEVTGHTHRIAKASANAFANGGAWDPSAERFIQALDGAELRHEEHGTISLPAGKYRVVQQREYHPDAIRHVVD
jgi:hypothetical protein